MSPDVLYQCTFFGPPQVSCSTGQTVSLGVKQMALLARLGAAENLQCERDVLTTTLWPDVSPRSARHSLSQALYDIRSRADPSLLYADQKVIRLGQATSDVQKFRRCVDQGLWESAAELYRGSFLVDFALEECLAFEHWVDSMRARYRGMAERVLQAVHQEGAWPAVLALSDALMLQYSDEAWVAAVRVNAIAELKGRKIANDWLRQLPRTQQLAVEEIWSGFGRTDADSTAASRTTFVGRERENRFLSEQLDQTNLKLRITLIEGEPGIGKTALASRFVRAQTLAGVLCLVAKAREAERNVPFAVVDQWLRTIPDRHLRSHTDRPWWDYLHSVFPILPAAKVESLTDPTSHRRILEALRRLLSSLASEHPIVLYVDDVHFADSASLGLLSYLARQERQPRALVLLTTRGDGAASIAPMADLSPVAPLRLGPISAEDLETWLHRNGLSDPQERANAAESLMKRTGGNPLLISAVLEGGRELRSDSPSATLVDFFKPIILELPPNAKLLLSALAISAEAISHDLLPRLLGVDATATGEAVGDLVRAKLALDENGKVCLRHGLIADVALALTPDTEKRRLHGRAARLYYRGETAGAAMAAVSYDIAGNRSDAYAAAMQAAKACAVLNAHEERLFFLKLAISNAPEEADATGATLAVGDVLLRLGRPRELLDLLNQASLTQAVRPLPSEMQVQRIRAQVALAATYEELKELWAECQSIPNDASMRSLADLYSDVGSVAYDFGSDKLASEILERTRKVLDQLPQSAEKARLLLRPLLIAGVIGSCDRASAELSELDRFLADDPTFDCTYRAVRGSLWVSAGRVVQAEAEFTEAQFIAERHALYDRLFLIYNNLGVCFVEQGRYSEAENQFTYAKEYGSIDDHPTNVSLASDNMSILLYESGRFEEVLRIAQEEVLRRSGKGKRSLISNYSLIGLSNLKLGRVGPAREAHRELRLLYSEDYPVRTDLSYMHIFQARMLFAEDDPKAAIAYLERAVLRYQSSLALTRWRLQLEASRMYIQIGLSPVDLELVKSEMAGSGASPLIELARGLSRRCGHS